MKIKKMLSILLAFIMILGVGSVFVGCKKKGGANSFTYWLGSAERSTYYRSYSDNPALKYILANNTFKNSAGTQQDIKLTFQTPPVNDEVNTLRNMMTTGSYPEIIDTAYGTGGVGIDELYADGIIVDLTQYVNDYMPNYKKYMDDNPELLPYMSTMVNGERKILSIGSTSEIVDWTSQFYGVSYRRDWIVAYGKDKNNNSFTGRFADESDKDSWTDNVTFPSWEQRDVKYDGNNRGMKWYKEWCDTNGVAWDGTDPVTISDWEWMLDIFKKALAALSVSDGYPMSLYSPGYIANGDLVCAFGGGGPTFYKNPQTNCQFGAVGNGFKAYLKCMNKWFSNGWINKSFMNNADSFYQIDEMLTSNGKVGLWNGVPSALGNRLEKESEPLTADMVVYGAAQPINDMNNYGGTDERMKIPYTMFQSDLLGSGIIVTHKAVDNKKDIALFCSFLDYMYSEEGSLIKSFGLSKTQQEQAKDSFYIKYGLDNGAYTTESINGETYYQRAEVLEENRDSIQSAATASKLPGINRNKNIKFRYAESYINSRNQWIKYENTGFFGGMANSLLMGTDFKAFETIKNKLEEQYMHKSVWQFIAGGKNLEGDWTTFCADLAKRDYATGILLRNKAIGVS